jgi:hypothetical protein
LSKLEENKEVDWNIRIKIKVQRTQYIYFLNVQEELATVKRAQWYEQLPTRSENKAVSRTKPFVMPLKFHERAATSLALA